VAQHEELDSFEADVRPISKNTRQRWFTAPIDRSFIDPDGRPLDMPLRRTY
jgi:hypothetical protein